LRDSQYAILGDLVRRGDAPPTIRELSESMDLDQSTIGQNLRPLEREGLVALVQDPADRRSRRITLTEAGRARHAQARLLWLKAQQHFETGLGERAAAELRTVLTGIASDPSLA
jgi:DNA-binding MarR family transcriptional regulator